ncbi:MAG: putative membrane protein [Halieaceae bacterium]|jgi:uncharacterized membrane protein
MNTGTSATPEIGACLSEGWAIYKREPLLLSGAVLLMIIIDAVASMVPFANAVVYGPLMGGLYLLIIRIDRGKPVRFANYFDAFRLFLPLLLGTVVMSLLIGLGLLLLVLPGIYLAIAYSFTILNIVDGEMEFWPAMEHSRKVLTAHFWSYLFLSLLFLGICMLGLLAAGVGLLVAVPFCLAAQYCFYRQLGAPATAVPGE